MKKYLLSALFLLLIVSLNAQQIQLRSIKSAGYPKDITKETSATSMNIGYCGDLAMSWILGANITMMGASEFPAATMKKYVGSQLTKVKIGIGTDTGIKNGKIFLANSMTEEPFYTQDVTFAADQWNEITLGTPYQITEKDLYIGFSLTSSSNAKASAFSTDNEQSSGFDYLALPDKNGKLNWYKAADLGVSYNLGIKGVVEGNSLPQYDLTLMSLAPEKGILAEGEKASLKGVLKSLGAQSIKSFDIAYQIGDAAPVTFSKADLNVNSTDRYSFTLDDLTVAPNKVTTIKVTLNNFNGLGNELTTDTMTTDVLCPGENSVPRKVLLENFTTAQCSACPQGHTTLESVINNNENVIWVAHHSGFYTDDYTISESEDYMWFYNSNSSYAPAIMMDRTDLRDKGAVPNPANATTPVFGVSKAAVIKTILDARLSAPAYVTVTMVKEYNESTKQLNLTVSGKAIYGSLPGIPRINVFLTENGLIGTQSGGGNKYEHNNVMRAVLTGTWGTPVTFDAEGNFTVTYNYTLDNKWKAANMNAVAFLSNYDPKNVMNCLVYNAQTIGVNPEAGINTSKADDSARIYANDSQITIEGEFTNATIYDTTGKIVENLGAQKTSSKVANGVYIVKITNNEQTTVKRVAVN